MKARSLALLAIFALFSMLIGACAPPVQAPESQQPAVVLAPTQTVSSASSNESLPTVAPTNPKERMCDLRVVVNVHYNEKGERHTYFRKVTTVRVDDHKWYDTDESNALHAEANKVALDIAASVNGELAQLSPVGPILKIIGGKDNGVSWENNECVAISGYTLYWTDSFAGKDMDARIIHKAEMSQFEVWLTSKSGSKVEFTLPWQAYIDIVEAHMQGKDSGISGKLSEFSQNPADVPIASLKNGREVGNYAFNYSYANDRALMLPVLTKAILLNAAYAPGKIYALTPYGGNPTVFNFGPGGKLDNSFYLFQSQLNTSGTTASSDPTVWGIVWEFSKP